MRNSPQEVFRRSDPEISDKIQEIPTMNWDAFGAIGEWAGAIAVIATLIYLARQIRQQNSIARFQVTHSLYHEMKDLCLTFSTDKEVTSIMKRGDVDPESLSDDEARRFQYMFRAYLVTVINAWKAYELGYLTNEEWYELAEEFAKNLETPGGAMFQKHSMQYIVPGFMEAVNSVRKSDRRQEDYSLGRVTADS